MRLTLLSALLAIFSYFNGNAQFVTTGFGSNSTNCSGFAQIQDSTTVTSILNWHNGTTVIQTGGYAIYNLCQGTYTVTFTTPNGTMTETFTISSNPCAGFSASVATTYISNPSACNGSATISVIGGTAPYSYSISNSNQTANSTINNLCEGYYNISVVDASGCSTYQYFSITQDSTNLTNCNGFLASLSTINATSNSICDGSFTVNVTGGTAPYTYNLNNGTNSPTQNNLCTGTYTVSVVDALGCVANTTGIVGNNTGANVGDTIIFNGTIFSDSSVVGTAISDWIDECSFDYNDVVSANISSYLSYIDSTLVTWQIGLNNGTQIYISAFYQFNSGFGVYDVILQLTCGQKDNPKYLQINSQINYQLVGISKNENAMFQLFPNPVQDELTISGINEAITYEIIDLKGRVLLTGNLSVIETKINVTNLYSGNYLFVVSSPKGTSNYNFVK
jgi:hypothetical protein